MNFKELLVETMAHIPPANALEDLTAEQASAKVPGAPHSIAEIVAHMNFWQNWFLRRCEGVAAPMVRSAAEGWPVPDAWALLRTEFLAGSRRGADIGSDPGATAKRVTPPIEMPQLAEYTIADALAHMAVHNSHHLGQIVTLRQIAGQWPPAAGSWTF